MNLSQRIDEDLKTALKAQDTLKVSTLRMLKAALGNLCIQRKKTTLEDSEVVEAIQRSIKQHEESIEAYRKGNRPDLADKETKESQILQAYLPPAMAEGELKALIQAAIASLGAKGPSSMGIVMKAVLEKVQGRADGKRVSGLVREALKE